MNFTQLTIKKHLQGKGFGKNITDLIGTAPEHTSNEYKGMEIHLTEAEKQATALQDKGLKVLWRNRDELKRKLAEIEDQIFYYREQIDIFCQTCKKTIQVIRDNSMSQNVKSIRCNWCPSCEDKAEEDYFEEHIT